MGMRFRGWEVFLRFFVVGWGFVVFCVEFMVFSFSGVLFFSFGRFGFYWRFGSLRRFRCRYCVICWL